MGLGGCLCYPASSSRVEPFPVIPCASSGTGTETSGNATANATAAAVGPGAAGSTTASAPGRPHPAAGSRQPSKKAPAKASDEAATTTCPHRSVVAFDLLATAGGGTGATHSAAAPLLESAAAAAGAVATTEAPGQRPGPRGGGPSAGLARGQHRLAAVSGPVTTGVNAPVNANGNGNGSGWGHSVGTISGISAGSKYCFTDSGNANAFPDFNDADIEYDNDDEPPYDPMYDSLVQPGVSEPGECCELTSAAAADCLARTLSGGTATTTASYAAAAAAAAAALRSGGGNSSGGGGASAAGPSRSTKSNGSTWSVKVMSDLQLAPDRYGRVRLPSILMFTHRRPPRDARTEAWWTKIRGVLVDTGRSMTSSFGQRSRRRARTGGTEDGGLSTGGGYGGGGGGSSCGGGLEEEVEEEDGEAGEVERRAESLGKPLKPSKDGRPPLRPPSRGGGGSRGCSSDGRAKASGGAAGGGGAELARSGSGGVVLRKSEAGKATAAAAAPPPPPPPAATAVEPAAGPGLPGAVAAVEGIGVSEPVRRPCSLAAAGSASGGGASMGQGSDGSGRSPRVSQAGRSRGFSRSGSRHPVADDSDAAAAAGSYGLSVHAFPRQLPPLGMAFVAGEGACEAPAEAAGEEGQTQTPTEEVRCGSVAFFGDALPGEQAALATAAAAAAAATTVASPLGAMHVKSFGRCPAGAAAALAAAAAAGLSCSPSRGRQQGASSSGVGSGPVPGLEGPAVAVAAGTTGATEAVGRYLPGHVARDSVPEQLIS